jgi:hypothetical protein
LVLLALWSNRARSSSLSQHKLILLSALLANPESPSDPSFDTFVFKPGRRTNGLIEFRIGAPLSDDVPRRVPVNDNAV